MLTVAIDSIDCATAAFAELSADLLKAGVGVRFRARGNSMAPLVRDGDALLVRWVDSSLLRVGDVVLCSCPPDRLVAHRVVRVEAGPDGPCFSVQGDQVALPDGVIRAAQIHGRVVAIERAGVQIDFDRPGLHLLGWAAALRSRWHLNRDWGLYRLTAGALRRLPAFCRHLA